MIDINVTVRRYMSTFIARAQIQNKDSNAINCRYQKLTWRIYVSVQLSPVAIKCRISVFVFDKLSAIKGHVQ